jgi:hypothetical protein
MVNLFGDWFNDLAAIFFVFVIYVIYRIWLNKDKLHNEWALVYAALIIFVISVFPFFSNIFWYDSTFSSIEGEYWSFILGVISLIAIIFGLRRIYYK